MKKLLLTLTVLLASIAANAQKFALVDMEYILKNVPAYERANEQLNQVSKKWEGEVEALLNEAETLYKKYQSESVFLSDAQKTKAEEAIMAKEKEASDLKKKYFGGEGSHPFKTKSTTPSRTSVTKKVTRLYSIVLLAVASSMPPQRLTSARKCS